MFLQPAVSLGGRGCVNMLKRLQAGTAAGLNILLPFILDRTFNGLSPVV